MTQALDGIALQHRPLLLAGEPVEGRESLPVVLPVRRREARERLARGRDQLERRSGSATAAEPELAAIPPFRRAEMLNAAAALVARSRGRAGAADDARDRKRDLGDALRGAAHGRDPHLRGRGGATDLTGELVPIDAVPRGEGRYGYTRRFPVGTVLAITPFNAPLLLVAHKLGPAFAAG